MHEYGLHPDYGTRGLRHSQYRKPETGACLVRPCAAIVPAYDHIPHLHREQYIMIYIIYKISWL
jgi:hypothetical protein